MGEIADDILEGACCQVCGEYVEGEPYGFPFTCSGCEADEDDDDDFLYEEDDDE